MKTKILASEAQEKVLKAHPQARAQRLLWGWQIRERIADKDTVLGIGRTEKHAWRNAEERLTDPHQP